MPVDLGEALKLGVGGQSVKSVYGQPATLVNLIVDSLFIVGGLLFFIIIILAGFKFIQSGSKGKDEAKSMIGTAIAGFLVMFVAYWIVQVIQILIGQQILF